MKWCSASQTPSKPARSASTAASTVRCSTSACDWPGNCAAGRNTPIRIGGSAAHVHARADRQQPGHDLRGAHRHPHAAVRGRAQRHGGFVVVCVFVVVFVGFVLLVLWFGFFFWCFFVFV